MDHEKAIRAAKLTLGGILEKRRAKTAVERAEGQIAPSKYMPGVPRQVHAYGGRASEKSDIWWHGSPSGDLRGGTSGLHLGTKEAALDALRARIGVPADGSMWDGTKSYGSTLLAGKNTLNKMGKYLISGHNVNAPDEDYYPHQHPRGFPTVGAGVPVDPEWRPFLKPFKIVGPMTNSPYSPHGDGRANSMMKASLTKGNAKNGYYYTNDGEDSGSISAVVPNGSHVVPLGEEPKQGYANGGPAMTEEQMISAMPVSPDGADRISAKLDDVAKAGMLGSNLAKLTGIPFAGKLGRLAAEAIATSKDGYANGGYVPMASLPIPKLAVAEALPIQRQPGLLDALSSLSSVGNSATEIAKLVSPKKWEAPKPHADRVEARAEGLTPEATSAMEALRKGWAGQDFGIVSGYRDPEHNERVGGAKDSQHTHGNAYDVNTTGWSPEEKLALADAAWNAGFRGFGFYDNNMHFDVGGERAWGPSYSRDSIPEWAQGWASQRYGYADGGEVTDLGQAREQKQMQTFHSGMMDDIHTRMTHAMEAHQKAVDAGVFDGYEVGDTLQGSAHPMRVTGRYMQAWKPTTMALRSFERMNTKPTIIEHEGKQYIPMLRYQTGKEGVDGFQEGSAYLDGVRAAGYQKMGGLRAVKADGGEVSAPQKTVKAYKLFRTKGDGKLYPLFVNADKPVPMGEWLEAEEGPQGKAQGKVKSKLGDLAYRPGWHAGDLPMATHIGGKSDPSLKKPDYRPDNHVWAEVEMAADKDWQSVADSRGKGVKAHITDQVPLGGFYRYKTNPNMTGNWLIGGNMKVNRVLPDEEVKAINDQAGTADLPRLPRGAFAAGGAAMFEGIHEDLQDEQGNPLELYHGTPGEGFSEFKDENLGKRDTGFYGRGHYLTPDQGSAEEYADPNQMGSGTVMGPLHAALKNPYVWDMSNETKAYSTLKDLHSMGIMRDRNTRMNPWDNLKSHEINTFMEHMGKRGHDGVIVKQPNWQDGEGSSVSEIVVFKPTAIKHKDAAVFDPKDPNIYRANGGAIK